MQIIYDSTKMKRRQGIGEDVGEGMRGSHVMAPRGLSLIVRMRSSSWSIPGAYLQRLLALLKLYLYISN
jgi:hypothetical protein